jgi:hypothetical protein
MTPTRRTPYRRPRDRREVVIAAAASGALVAFTVVMVWVLGPHSSGSSPSAPSAPPISTPSPSVSTPSSTPASTSPSSTTGR